MSLVRAMSSRLKEDGRLDWHKTAQALYNQVRGMDPWPGTFTVLDGKTLRILGADYMPEHAPEEPGTVVKADDTGIVVTTGKGALVLKRVQLQGKKRLPVGNFLRGRPIAAGTRLG